MYKNLEEFKKQYYPRKREMEKYALQRFVDEQCCTRYSTRVSNALFRAGIESIEDLIRADVNELRRARCLGDKAVEELMMAKMYIKHEVEEL
jgi:DNA-directed RNA polymerase alpha subunit